ncbi:MAG: hypothetical protein LAKADJCE_00074 [Candidatus Argoarchaeum ethanivorans]|uniref:Uncharacterized protein n=1 Tax=Candidatus Argoarchaeum ethanivorans TaxID=2608793 RepID=A0A811T6U7_9EURY|nr:MAG: hypothetical protein LAKADJCE_00074 [Candidatus Argoarchaeum ethanivorans]
MQGVMVATLERKVECRVVRDEKIKYALEETNGLRNRLVHGYRDINAFVLQCKMRCILVHKNVFFCNTQGSLLLRKRFSIGCPNLSHQHLGVLPLQVFQPFHRKGQARDRFFNLTQVDVRP